MGISSRTDFWASSRAALASRRHITERASLEVRTRDDHRRDASDDAVFCTRISFIRAHPRGWWTTARTTGRTTTTRPIDRIINPSKQSAARERVSGSFFSGDSARARWATRRENATKESASRSNSFSSRVRVASSVGSSVRRPGFGSDRSVDRTEEARSDRTSPPPPPGFVRVLLYARVVRREHSNPWFDGELNYDYMIISVFRRESE